MLVNMLVFVFLLIVVQSSHAVGLCEQCDCFPHTAPSQVYCDNSTSEGRQNITISLGRRDLKLLHIYGYNLVELTMESNHTSTPITVLIYHTQNVTVHGLAVASIDSLTIAYVQHLRLKESTLAGLSNQLVIRLRYIKQLIIEPNAVDLKGIYSIELHNVFNVEMMAQSMSIVTQEFKMANCSVKPLPNSSIIVYTTKANIDHCFFEGLSPYAINIKADLEINITNNKFQDFNESSLFLSAQSINVTSNSFKTLPAKSLKSMSANNSLYFMNNKIYDIDLGGVILSMDYRKFFFINNVINCSCQPTAMSVLMPQDDFPILHTFKELFKVNLCKSDCNMTLMDFSDHLVREEICRNNQTLLTSDDLCNLTQTDISRSTKSPESTSSVSEGFVLGSHNFLLILTLGHLYLRYLKSVDFIKF